MISRLTARAEVAEKPMGGRKFRPGVPFFGYKGGGVWSGGGAFVGGLQSVGALFRVESRGFICAG